VVEGFLLAAAALQTDRHHLDASLRFFAAGRRGACPAKKEPRTITKIRGEINI
jgi:hypothetical protein